MKRIIGVLIAGAMLLLTSSAASAAEEGWEVYRKARPKLALKSAAVARVLSPFGQVPELPIEPAPNVLLSQVTITLSPGTYENLYIKGNDIVLLDGEDGERNYFFATGENGVIEPGATILYDNEMFRNHPVLIISGRSNLRIGALGGEVVNFSGVRINDGGNYYGSTALLNIGNTVQVYEAVFINHLEALAGFGSETRNIITEGAYAYFIKNVYGLVVGSNAGFETAKPADLHINIDSPYFSGNLESISRGASGDRGSAELTNVFFGPGQSPLAEWDTIIGREYYAQVFTITELAPSSVLGQINVIQTWPREVLFAREDFDRDGLITPTDLAFMAEAIGESANASLFGWWYDLDENGVIGAGDFRRLFQPFTGNSLEEPVQTLVKNPRVHQFFATLAQHETANAAVEADPILGTLMHRLNDFTTAVAEVSGETPDTFSLGQNHPNPFNAETAILYQIAEETDVSLVVYDMLGRRVATLVAEHQLPGTYRATWDGLDNGQSVASGTYFYRLVAGAFTETRRMTLLR